MTLLLDAHTLLCFLADDPRFSATAKAAIEDPVNERWLSPISLLEIALKNPDRHGFWGYIQTSQPFEGGYTSTRC